MVDIRYDIRDYRDLFSKLKREAGRFEEDPSADNLFNAMVTAWSLADWVWSDVAVTREMVTYLTRITGQTRRNGTYDYAEMDPYMRMCHNIATASKHGLVDNRRAIIVSEVGAEEGGYGDGPYGMGPYGGGRFYVVYCGDEAYSASEIVEHVIHLYEDFFATFALLD